MKKVFFYSSTNIHGIYQNMLLNSPDGFQYEKHEYVAIPAPSNLYLRSLFSNLSPYYNYFHAFLGFPKIRKFNISGFDLIHSTQSLLDPNIPYVLDFEHAAVFSGYNQFALSNTRFLTNLKKILENKKLKKIMPWTKAAKSSLINFVNSDEIARKIEVVCPPVVVQPAIETKNKHSDGRPLQFLFIGKVFFEKGGLDTLLAFDQLSKKFDAELTMVSTVPEDIKHRFFNNKRIKILTAITELELKELYKYSDVLVLPTHYDTFGFVIAEAFSYGLPVITDNSFCRSELVEHETTGLLLDPYYSSFGKKGEYIYPTSAELVRKRKEVCMNPPQWYVDSLAAAMERMIIDGALRKKCSYNARKETTEGKFSPKVWKEKMKRIYSESMQ